MLLHFFATCRLFIIEIQESYLYSFVHFGQTTNLLKSSLSTFRNCLTRYKDPGKLIANFSKTSLEISTPRTLSHETRKLSNQARPLSPARLAESKRTRKSMNLLFEVLFGGLELPEGEGRFLYLSISSQVAHHSRFLRHRQSSNCNSRSGFHHRYCLDPHIRCRW